jgi:hypothetical protein
VVSSLHVCCKNVVYICISALISIIVLYCRQSMMTEMDVSCRLLVVPGHIIISNKERHKPNEIHACVRDAIHTHAYKEGKINKLINGSNHQKNVLLRVSKMSRRKNQFVSWTNYVPKPWYGYTLHNLLCPVSKQTAMFETSSVTMPVHSDYFISCSNTDMSVNRVSIYLMIYIIKYFSDNTRQFQYFFLYL